jgi:hypothetical protein
MPQTEGPVSLGAVTIPEALADTGGGGSVTEGGGCDGGGDAAPEESP